MSDLGPSWSEDPAAPQVKDSSQPPPPTRPPPPKPNTGRGTLQTRTQFAVRQNPYGHFEFDGGAATYWGTGLVAFLITLFSFGLLYPLGLVMLERWKAKHTIIDGRRLRFTGTATGLFGHWIKWWFLTVITAGIYSLWVRPRIIKWKTERTTFA